MTMDLSGKAAIVTGAGPGMGRSIAVELARQGVDIGAVADIGLDESYLTEF